MYQGWTEPPDVIEARKARILATFPRAAEPLPAQDQDELSLADCLQIVDDLNGQRRAVFQGER